MYELPITVLVNDIEYTIRNKGDFRMVLDCFSALGDMELEEQFRVYTALIIFYEAIKSIEDVYAVFGNNVNEAITKMYDFFNCGQSDIGLKTPYKLIDWKQDEQMICAAVNNVANKEIRFEPYIHWWTFMGYYCSVGESTLSTVVNIRSKILKGKRLEKYEKEFKRDNPQYFNWRSKTAQQEEDDRLIREIWNSQ